MLLRIISLLIAAAMLVLAQISWRNSSNESELELHPSRTQAVDSAADLRRQLEDLDHRIDFMVWPTQRSELLEQKVALLQFVYDIWSSF